MSYLLHYGLQRSGTNFFESIINQNYKVKFLNDNSNRSHPLQKHFRLYDNKELIPEPQYKNDLRFSSFDEYEDSLGLKRPIQGIIIVSKDPYSWFLSYNKWAKKCNWPPHSYNYIEEYNEFYGKWLDFRSQDPRILFVKYLDILINTQDILKLLESKYNLELRFARRLLGRKFTLQKVSQSKQFSAQRMFYYQKKRYLRDLNPKDLDSINLTVSPAVMKGLGYQIEEIAFQKES